MAPSTADAPWRSRAGLFLVDHQGDGGSSRQPSGAVPAEPAAPARGLREPANLARAREPRPVAVETGPLTRHSGAPVADTLVGDAEAAPSGAVARESAGSRLCE